MGFNEKKDKLFKELMNAMSSSLIDSKNHIVTINGTDYSVSAKMNKYNVRTCIYDDEDLDSIVMILVPRTDYALFELATMAETYFELKSRPNKDKGE